MLRNWLVVGEDVPENLASQKNAKTKIDEDSLVAGNSVYANEFGEPVDI